MRPLIRHCMVSSADMQLAMQCSAGNAIERSRQIRHFGFR